LHSNQQGFDACRRGGSIYNHLLALTLTAHHLTGVLAAAHVTEAAATFKKVVADLIDLLHFLLDVPLVDASALVAVATAPC
jgi:hypothetical protein